MTIKKIVGGELKSFQRRVITELERFTVAEGCELIQVQSGGNVGKLIAQVKNPAFGGPIQSVAYLSYHFQEGHNKIQFNGAPMGPGDMSYLFDETDDRQINEMIRKWGTLIRDGKRDGLQQVGA